MLKSFSVLWLLYLETCIIKQLIKIFPHPCVLTLYSITLTVYNVVETADSIGAFNNFIKAHYRY